MAIFTQEASLVRERRQLEPSPRCLDLGCGPGLIAGSIADLGFHVVGVDRSEGMVGAAKHLAARRTARRGKLNFVRADVTEFVSACQETFSLVISSSVLEYLDDPMKVVRLASSRLRAGGTFAFSIPNFGAISRTIEPWVQGLVPVRSRYRKFWGNELSAADYVGSAVELGLSLEKVRTFGLPKIPFGAIEPVFRNRFFQTMTLLVFRRL
jgi:2-polyprenyl-3-methyl-5-hydroxy-6-metoxy-1,4-benzoquinol methylase